MGQPRGLGRCRGDSGYGHDICNQTWLAWTRPSTPGSKGWQQTAPESAATQRQEGQMKKMMLQVKEVQQKIINKLTSSKRYTCPHSLLFNDHINLIWKWPGRHEGITWRYSWTEGTMEPEINWSFISILLSEIYKFKNKIKTYVNVAHPWGVWKVNVCSFED